MTSSAEFLEKEYELCFEQLRYYDDRHTDILKYLFALASSVATAQFAVFTFFKGPTQFFFMSLGFLGALVFVANLLLYCAMVQNRVYFVFVARQVNAIRGFLLRTVASDFDKNQMYTSVDLPMARLPSVHTFQLVGAAIITSSFAGVSVCGFSSPTDLASATARGVLTLGLTALVLIGGGVAYLKRADSKTADEVIHAGRL